MAASDAAPAVPAATTGGAPRVPPAEPWWRDSLVVTFSFTCNLACTFCMVEDVLDVYEGTSLAAFERAAKNPETLRGKRRIIFSGGEVTLDDRLADYARLARGLPGVEHVRVQTNATRLARRDYLDGLLAAGVDELYVSIHGHDEALCDALTRRHGSFRAILAGLEAIAASGATLITNTAVVQPNFPHLARIVEVVAPFRPRSMEFSGYWPHSDEDLGRDLAPRVADVQPALAEALRACLARGIPPVARWFPRCLLGDLAPYHDDGQPPVLIEETYWDREPTYGCIYEGVCADAAPLCTGLSFPYIERHGWEEGLLRPRRVAPPGTERGAVQHALLRDPAPERGDAARLATWLADLGVRPDVPFAGYHLAACVLSADRRNVTARFEREGERVDVVLRGRDPAKRSFLRTPSFDLLTARPPPGREADVLAVVRAVARAVAAADRGGLTLPA